MSNRIVPAGEFAKWLEREHNKQKSRMKMTNTVSKYRSYAVGNAMAIWDREYAYHTDRGLTIDAYRQFRARMLQGAQSNASAGTTEGYTIVLRMLDRVGIKF